MLALSDRQLKNVMTIAGKLPVEKRSAFLERIAARLELAGTHFSDADLADAVRIERDPHSVKKAFAESTKNSGKWYGPF